MRIGKLHSDEGGAAARPRRSSNYDPRNVKNTIREDSMTALKLAAAGAAATATTSERRHGRRAADHPHGHVVARRRASRAVRARLLQAGRRADRRQGQVPDLPGRHHRQPAEDHGVGAEEGGAGRPLAGPATTGASTRPRRSSAATSDRRPPRRCCTGSTPPAASTCGASGAWRSSAWSASRAAPTRTRSTCIPGSPSAPSRTSRA